MHLTGALLAPAFDEVDAYISYTVRIIHNILRKRLYFKTQLYHFTIKLPLGARNEVYIMYIYINICIDLYI